MTCAEHSQIEALAQHLLRPVDEATLDRARLHLLDWLGCVAGARRGPAGDAVKRMRGDVLHRAALLGNVLEMDDVHRGALLHPGPVIWPTALSVPSSGSLHDVLAAGVRGYEAMISVGIAFDRRHYAHYHPTATAGGFGAAACAVGTVGEVAVLAHALALAGSVSGGVWQTRHSDNLAKQWHVTHAVRTGQAAAQHAVAGVTGPLDVLEGAQGLYAATCRAPGIMKLDAGWRIADVSFKPWGACRHAHPAIDAALHLRETGALTGNVVVETYGDALVFCDRPHPQTPSEAKFSIQHAVAIVAERGAPTLADFAPDAIATLSAARARVSVTEDAACTRRYPAHFGARVTTQKGSIALIDTLGDPERPLSREGVVAKARALMAWGGIVESQAERCVDIALTGRDASAVVGWLDAIL